MSVLKKLANTKLDSRPEISRVALRTSLVLKLRLVPYYTIKRKYKENSAKLSEPWCDNCQNASSSEFYTFNRTHFSRSFSVCLLFLLSYLYISPPFHKSSWKGVYFFVFYLSLWSVVSTINFVSPFDSKISTTVSGINLLILWHLSRSTLDSTVNFAISFRSLSVLVAPWVYSILVVSEYRMI